MNDYKRIPTTKEVFAVLHASHPELEVFGSYSAPDGDQFGDPDECVMKTQFGFNGCDYPITESKVSWTKNSENPLIKENHKHEYWLCVAQDTTNG